MFKPAPRGHAQHFSVTIHSIFYFYLGTKYLAINFFTMSEEIQFILDSMKEQMDKAISHLENELTKIRAGRANPSMLEGIHVDYYGTRTPLHQVSNVNTPDARTLAITPWEKNMLEPIQKAIQAANLGFNPNNNGSMIIINVPALTEERRKDLVKKTKEIGRASCRERV